MAQVHPDDHYPWLPEQLEDRIFDTTKYDDYEQNPWVCQSNNRARPKNGLWYQAQCPYSERCPCGCGKRDIHADSIVIAVDGACRNNGFDGARASYAAYFHDRNVTYNTSALLAGPVQTSQRAELMAGLAALHLALQVKKLNKPSNQHRRLDPDDEFSPEKLLTQVVIQSDSEYLVKGMTLWIYKWRQNGFLTAKQTPVVNADLFRLVDEKIDALNDQGVRVQFWHVPRRLNEHADYLANCKLDGISARDAMRMIEED